MEIIVRQAATEDADAIGHVHHQAWIETYTGLIDSDYLAGRSAKRSADRFRAEQCRNKLVVEVEHRVVGFCHYDQAQDDDVPSSCGEIQAIYVLEAYQGISAGRQLMERAEQELSGLGYDQIILWALAANEKAIGFYQRMGYHFDGHEKMETLGTPVLLKRFFKRL